MGWGCAGCAEFCGVALVGASLASSEPPELEAGVSSFFSVGWAGAGPNEKVLGAGIDGAAGGLEAAALNEAALGNVGAGADVEGAGNPKGDEGFAGCWFGSVPAAGLVGA